MVKTEDIEKAGSCWESNPGHCFRLVTFEFIYFLCEAKMLPAVHILHKMVEVVVTLCTGSSNLRLWFHFLSLSLSLSLSLPLSLSPQKIRVLPAVGKDPESQRSERIKVGNLTTEHFHRCLHFM